MEGLDMKRFNLMVILAAILATAAVIAHAQIGVLPSPVTPPGASTQRPVLTGENLGFRVERMDGNRPVGELVIRQNGLWVPVELGGTGVKQLTLK
jgi:hypothetical protein